MEKARKLGKMSRSCTMGAHSCDGLAWPTRLPCICSCHEDKDEE